MEINKEPVEGERECRHEPACFIVGPGRMWRATCIQCGMILVNLDGGVVVPEEGEEWEWFDFAAYGERKPWRYAEVVEAHRVEGY